jgi:hypothetical protein
VAVLSPASICQIGFDLENFFACIRYDENIVEDNLPSIHFEMKKEF